MMHYTYYASDILEAAMELAQSKALNSYSFRDCMNWLTELWQYCYERIAQIDEGYYSRVVKLTQPLTHLPPYVKNSVRVYAARDMEGTPDEFPRRYPYRASSMTDLDAQRTYHISGFDLFVPDVNRTSRIIWLEYTPEPPFLTYTKNNRDPKVFQDPPDTPLNLYPAKTRYGAWDISGDGTPTLPYKATNLYDNTLILDLTDLLIHDNKAIHNIFLDSPYMFITYKDTKTNDYEAWILKDACTDPRWIRFNPFDFQGRASNIEYLSVKWNDYTGMGCIIRDNETNRILELGWTPDTVINYPSPIMRNYMVAHLARKFADLNGAQIQAIENEIASSTYQMSNFLARDKSAWFRVDRVIGPSLGDVL